MNKYIIYLYGNGRGIVGSGIMEKWTCDDLTVSNEFARDKSIGWRGHPVTVYESGVSAQNSPTRGNWFNGEDVMQYGN